MPRGRLISKFLIGVCRLDTQATADVVGGGYDEDFREPIKTAVAGNPVGQSSRREMAEVRVPVQIHTERVNEQQQMAGGQTPKTRTVYLAHVKWLERNGLVGTDGRALIKPGDRIAALYQKDGTLIETFTNPPGQYVVKAVPDSYGLALHNPKRNILAITIDDRQQQ